MRDIVVGASTGRPDYKCVTSQPSNAQTRRRLEDVRSIRRLMEVNMQSHDQAEYLGERIAFEDRVAALARSREARRIHAELAMHYRSELALLRATPDRSGVAHA